MSRAATLSNGHRDRLQAFVRAAEAQYGISHADIADHDCKFPPRRVKTEVPSHIKFPGHDEPLPFHPCPCRGQDPEQLYAFVRNAMKTGQPISPALAVKLLRLVNGAKKVRDWRRAASSHDAWLEALRKVLPIMQAVKNGHPDAPKFLRTGTDAGKRKRLRADSAA